MPLSRRQFGAAIGAGLSLANVNLFADHPKPKPLRVIAYNIFGLTGWPHQRRLAQQAVAIRWIIPEKAVYWEDPS